jgi:hypothetical protein
MTYYEKLKQFRGLRASPGISPHNKSSGAQPRTPFSQETQGERKKNQGLTASRAQRKPMPSTLSRGLSLPRLETRTWPGTS